MSERGRPLAEVLIADARGVCSRVELVSSRLAPIARAQLDFDPHQEQRVVLQPGAPVVVGLGWLATGIQPVFRGRVRQVEPAATHQRVVALDRGWDLDTLTIRQAFNQATLQEVLGAAFDEHGIPHRISRRRTIRVRRFVAPNHSLLSTVRAARQTWPEAFDWDLWVGVDGVMHFEPWSETERALAEPAADLEYGRNLLAFWPTTRGSGRAETYLEPGIEHSRRVRLWHRDLWTGPMMVRVDRVEHLVAGDEFARTRIEWTAVN